MSNKEWEYRVVRQKKDGNEWLSVQEVYLDEETGKPMAHTTDLEVTGDSLGEIRKQLQSMLWSLDKTVLDGMPGPESGNEFMNVETDENTTYIYESPDGGKTLYRRKFGESEREKMDKTL